MSLFSEFREKLKVKTEDKRVRKYTGNDINIRKDEETGNLELYLEETLSSSKEKGKGWSTARYRKRDINIRNPKDKIYYTFVVSPSGHFYRREYDDYEQGRRYQVLYSVPSVLQQLLGVSREHAYNMQFTREELIDLIEKINLEKENAVFQYIDTVQYSENYKGKKTLEGLHIAIGYRDFQNCKKYFLKCVEDENIKIRINDNGTLEIMKDGKKENISRVNYSFVSTEILEKVSPGRYTDLGGYTLEAVQKIVEEYKKEKDNKREEK